MCAGSGDKKVGGMGENGHEDIGSDCNRIFVWFHSIRALDILKVTLAILIMSPISGGETAMITAGLVAASVSGGKHLVYSSGDSVCAAVGCVFCLYDCDCGET